MGMFDTVVVEETFFPKNSTIPILLGNYQTKSIHNSLFVYQINSDGKIHLDAPEHIAKNKNFKILTQDEVEIYKPFHADDLEFLLENNKEALFHINLFENSVKYKWLEYRLKFYRRKIVSIEIAKHPFF
jgi:hypothetical protein